MKRDGEGENVHFKCRLVAQGYSQVEGVDYEEKFAPVARFRSIRTLLAVGVQRGMKIYEMDIVTSFLNGTLKEEIYVISQEKEEIISHISPN